MIGQIPGFLHCSTGDLFRALDKSSECGKAFLEYSTKGLLVPDNFTITLLKNHLDKLVKAGTFHPGKSIVVLDGVPRNVNQANLLADAIVVKKIIFLECADIDKMVARLKKRATNSGRLDDADENVVRNRMAIYAKETAPVLACYDKNLVAKIEADQPIIQVFSDIVKTLTSVKEDLAGVSSLTDAALSAARGSERLACDQ